MSKQQIVAIEEEYLSKGEKWPGDWKKKMTEYVELVYGETKPWHAHYFQQPSTKKRIKEKGRVSVPKLVVFEDPRTWTNEQIYTRRLEWIRINVDPPYGNMPANWTTPEITYFAQAYHDYVKELNRSRKIAPEFIAAEREILIAEGLLEDDTPLPEESKKTKTPSPEPEEVKE